jgi:hypothetical protein
MTRFDFDVIGDTPALKSRPPERMAAPVPPAEKPVAEQPPEGPQMARRQDNAA